MKHKFVPIAYSNESNSFSAYDLENFLIWAVEHEVSDITLQNEEMIFCEIHGKKHKVNSKRLSKSDIVGIIAKIHSDGAVARLNGGEEIDYAFSVKKNREINYRFRVNMKSISIGNLKGYSLSIRILNSRPLNVKDLNLPEDMLRAFKSRRGLIIVSGPTGSGKSTLLASVLAWRLVDEDAHIKVSTYEAPIEYTFEYLETPTATISQMEIGIDIDSFADGVRNSLRTRSDVVLVGEARDYETISATIQTSLTGPLVYSTTHTNNVPEIIARLINYLPNNERESMYADLITNLKMLVTQKLIPSIEGKRIAIREYLIFNEEIKDILLDTKLENVTLVMRQILKKHGHPFSKDLTKKYNAGLISKEVYEEYLD